MDTSPQPPEHLNRDPRLPRTSIEKTVHRIQLCSYAVQEAHTEVDYPTDPEDKADLLLAVENLTAEVLDLLGTVKNYAWGVGHEENNLPTEQ